MPTAVARQAGADPMPRPPLTLPSPRALRIAYLAIAALLVLTSLTWRPRLHGDGWEYAVTLEALWRHATPDIRPGDDATLLEWLGNEAPPAEARERCLLPARSGARYTLHFWLYPLIALPARAVLATAGINPLAAMPATNTAIALAALGWVLFVSRLEPRLRLTLAGLAAITPVYWYVRWPHPEVLCWSLGLVSAAALLERRWALAALGPALASAQNPPLALVALAVLGLAALEGGWRAAFSATLASLPVALAPAFNLVAFGVANPLAAGGATDRSLVTWARTWSFLTDANLGVLPWVPAILPLALLALARLPWTRDVVVLALATAVLAMIKLCELTNNWNAGAAGLIRYAVWMLPWLAAMAARGLPRGRVATTVLAIGLLLQGAIVARQDWKRGYLRHTPLAAWLLSEHPRWYDPDPEIFAERQLGAELAYRKLLPLAFGRADGTLSKVLVDRRACGRLHRRYQVDPAYLEQVLARCAVEPGTFYLTPPQGAVRRRASDGR